MRPPTDRRTTRLHKLLLTVGGGGAVALLLATATGANTAGGAAGSATGRIMLWYAGNLEVPFELVNQSPKAVTITPCAGMAGVLYTAHLSQGRKDIYRGHCTLRGLGGPVPKLVLRPGESYRSTIRAEYPVSGVDPGSYDVVIRYVGHIDPGLTPMHLEATCPVELYRFFPPYEGRPVPPKPVRLVYRG